MLLVRNPNGVTLDVPAMASFTRMESQHGGPIPVTSSYRTPKEQQKLIDAWLAGKGNYASPVNKSKHVQGLALDIAGATAKAWMNAHAPANGWRRTDPREDWHWEYNAALDRFLNAPRPVPVPVPAPLPNEEDDMENFVRTLFRYYYDSEADPLTVAKHAMQALDSEWTRAQLRATFIRNAANVSTVHRAYADFLGHAPSPEAVDAWLPNTVDAVWNGVRNSPEAQAR